MSMILLCVFVFENVCCRYLDVLHLFCAAVIFFGLLSGRTKLYNTTPHFISLHSPISVLVLPT